MKYVKKPIPAQVKFARQAGTLETLEGPVAFGEGDALMTGVKGERWPIRRPRFEETYAPVPPTRMGENGRYLKKPKPVTARQTTIDETIDLGGDRGVLQAKPGDWIVTADDGRRWVVANDIFLATYQPIE